MSTDFLSLYVIIENFCVKSVLGLPVIALSLDFVFLTGLSLCLHELLGSALVKNELCVVLTMHIFLQYLFTYSFKFYPFSLENINTLPEIFLQPL